MSPLARFVALYAFLYAGFGVSSPFMPSFFASRGLAAEEIGVLLAAGTAVRLVSGPAGGRLADLTRALRAVLAGGAALAALLALALLPARGFGWLFVIAVLHQAALAPLTSLADALALAAAGRRGSGFEYGWVRGAGSGIFVAGTLASGQAVGTWGLAAAVSAHAALLAAAAPAALQVPEVGARAAAIPARAGPRGVADLLRIAPFRYVMLVSALVLGSHAMHDAFALIRWSAAGVTPAVASALWSASVAAEVLVFFVVGPRLVERLRPAGVLALAAAAGALRWGVVAWTADVLALALVQPLHGLTFAALHLACMRVIAAVTPRDLAATAQAMYALAAGVTTTLLTLAAGWLYGSLGARGFLVMALLCVAALPVTARLRAVTG